MTCISPGARRRGSRGKRVVDSAGRCSCRPATTSEGASRAVLADAGMVLRLDLQVGNLQGCADGWCGTIARPPDARRLHGRRDARRRQLPRCPVQQPGAAAILGSRIALRASGPSVRAHRPDAPPALATRACARPDRPVRVAGLRPLLRPVVLGTPADDRRGSGGRAGDRSDDDACCWRPLKDWNGCAYAARSGRCWHLPASREWQSAHNTSWSR